MPDFVTDEEGKLTQVRYDRVKCRVGLAADAGSFLSENESKMNEKDPAAVGCGPPYRCCAQTAGPRLR